MDNTPSKKAAGPKGPTALCLSGGGIRSATFSLGVLQGLAKAGWLSRFTYLSTVSGGGYIGSWLTSWISHAHQPRRGVDPGIDGVDFVCKQLRDSVTKGKKEPPEISRLRAYSNYLSPRNGISADFLTLIATFLRNMLLNWLVIVPMIAGIVLVPMCVLTLMEHVTTSLFGPLLLVAIACGVCALAYATSDVPKHAEHQTITSRFQSYWLAPMFLSCVLVAAATRPVVGTWSLTLWPRDFHLDTLLSELNLCVAAVIGMAIHVLGLLIGVWARGKRKIHGRSRTNQERVTEAFKEHVRHGWSGIRGRGLTFAALSGAGGGMLVWGVLWLFQEYLSASVGPLKDYPNLRYLVFDTLSVPTFLVCFQLGTALYVAFLSKDDDDGVREWWGRAGGYAMMAAVLWILSFFVAIWLPALLVHLKPNLTSVGGLGGLGGLVALLGGFFGGNSAHATSESAKSIWGRIADNALVIGAGLFILALLVFSAMGWTWLLKIYQGVPINTASQYVEVVTGNWWVWGAAFGLAVLWVFLASLFIGSNTFSMQSLYGNRLTRAYLGSTRPKGARHPHAFTEFDPEDDIDLAESVPTRGQTARLRHVINVALNVSRPTEEQLAWQQRKAAPFSFSAKWCGSPALAQERRPGETRRKRIDGTVPTRCYADSTLGMAMSLSGAAASPNMGYHTSPLVAFVLTFFNVRLGAWLPNPARRFSSPDLMKHREPRTALSPLIHELLGRSTTEKPFVYLSDGGHFENLGLYEMVRRKCKRIVVVDASCDPPYEFEDLEASIRRIHSDLGARIEFPEGLPTPKYCAKTAEHFVVGRIDYGENVFGELIYIKPVLGGDEPVDVTQYSVRSRRAGGKFPHDPTSDQFFDESQFESYRSLGYHSIGRNFPKWEDDVCEERSGRADAKDHEDVGRDIEVSQNGSKKRSVEMEELLKNFVPAVSGVAGGATKSMAGIPAWLALLALPAAGAGGYWMTNKSETLIAVVPPTADTSVTHVAMVDQLVVRPEQDRRIMLPVFSEACSRENKAPDCIGRPYARTPDPAAAELLTRIAQYVVKTCAVHSPVRISIKGYSSSSEFRDPDSQQKNVELADERAWAVLKVLNPEGGANEPAIKNVTYQFTPRFCNASQPYAALCTDSPSQEEPTLSRMRLKAAYEELDLERIPDRHEDTGEAQPAMQDRYYAGTGQMNRRVDLLFEEIGDCTLRDIWSELLQPRSGGSQSVARLGP